MHLDEDKKKYFYRWFEVFYIIDKVSGDSDFVFCHSLNEAEN